MLVLQKMQNLKDVRALCKKEGIVFQAFPSPWGRSLGLLDKKVVKNIDSRVWVSEAQVSLRWAWLYTSAQVCQGGKDEE